MVAQTAAQTSVRVLALYAETALHPGSGSSTGAVDLPVTRERHTGFPIINASSLKGSLRQRAESMWTKTDPKVTALFGPEVQGGTNLHAGAITFGEVRLIAFPVRSTSQVFVWVTCPLVLDRLRLDLRRAGKTLPAGPANPPSIEEAIAPTATNLSPEIVLEDLSFTVQANQEARDIADWLATNLVPAAHQEMAAKLRQHLLIISDEDYEHLVRTATQLSARTKLNDQKTTTGDGGNFWYEETLPRDCLLTAILRVERERSTTSGAMTANEVAQQLGVLLTDDAFIQLGGNETTGQGWCAARLQ